MRNIITTLVIGLALLSMSATAANLLTDPGFDTQGVAALQWTPDPAHPWWGGGGSPNNSNSGGGGWITDARAESPTHSATLFIYGVDTWAYGMAAQTLASGITEGQTYGLSADFLRTGSLATSEAILKVEWLDSNGSNLSAAESTAKFTDAYAANVWNNLNAQFVAPTGAVGAKYEMVFRRNAAGADPGDIYVDNASFALIPEPSSIALLAMGGIALVGVVRRKMKK